MMRNRFNPHIKTTFLIVFFACSTLACFSIYSTSDFATPSKTDTSNNDMSTMTVSPSGSLPDLDSFSLENINKISPENVLDEVSYSSSGGVPPKGCPHLDSTGPTLGFLFGAKEILTDETKYKTIKTCGWEIGEIVTVTVRQPSGTLRQEEYIEAVQDFEYVDPIGIAHYDFVPTPGEFGVYSILFSGESGQMRHSLFVSSARVTDLPKVRDDHIGLQGLVPNEKVRIYAYESVPDCQNCMGEGVNRLIAWDDFNADANGELVVTIDVTTSKSAMGIYFLAIAEKSGIPRSLSLTSVLEIDLDGSCVTSGWTPSDGMPARLGIGDFAYAALASSQPIPLQNNPGENQGNMSKLSPGEVVKIIDGPTCIDSINWWRVEDRLGNFEGWVMEGYGEYFLVPCSKKNQACLLP